MTTCPRCGGELYTEITVDEVRGAMETVDAVITCGECGYEPTTEELTA